MDKQITFFLDFQLKAISYVQVSKTGMRLKPKGKKSKNGSRIWCSAILKEVFSSHEELSSREAIFIRNHSCIFFYRRLSLIISEFSHLICLNHKTHINLPKNWKSSENRANLMPAKKQQLPKVEAGIKMPSKICSFSKDLYCRHVKTRACLGKVKCILHLLFYTLHKFGWTDARTYTELSLWQPCLAPRKQARQKQQLAKPEVGVKCI